MMRWKMILLGCATLLLLAAGGLVIGQSSTSFQLNWSTIAGGGGDSQSPDYRVEGTVGQALAHTEAASASYRLEGGFWLPFAGVKAPPFKRLYLPVIVR